MKKVIRCAPGFSVALAGLLLSGCGGGFVESGLGPALQRCTELPQDADTWRPGCATHRNMVAVAADPRDLTRARAEAPRDAMRRDAVIAGYARKRSEGEQAAAPRPASQASEKGGSQ
jgi:hypothetical protein